jgi:hypothetical protein
LEICLISSGSTEDNAEAERLRLNHVLLQDAYEVMEAYRAPGTPSAVMVSPDGRIASSVAIGAAAVEPLIRVALRRQAAAPPPLSRSAASGPPTDPSGSPVVVVNGAPAERPTG